MKDSGFGCHDEFAIGGFGRTADHSFGRENLHSIRRNRAGGHRFHDAGRAAAFRVDQQLGTRMIGTLSGETQGGDTGVYVTLTQPDMDVLPTGYAPDVRAEEEVG